MEPSLVVSPGRNQLQSSIGDAEDCIWGGQGTRGEGRQATLPWELDTRLDLPYLTFESFAFGDLSDVESRPASERSTKAPFGNPRG